MWLPTFLHELQQIKFDINCLWLEFSFSINILDLVPFFPSLNCFAMCNLQLIRAETSIQYSSQVRAIVHDDHQKIVFLFMLLLFIFFRPIYIHIYITLKIKWTFWALPDSIKLHENQAENLSWNLVPRPISILCSPGAEASFSITMPSCQYVICSDWKHWSFVLE